MVVVVVGALRGGRVVAAVAAAAHVADVVARQAVRLELVAAAQLPRHAAPARQHVAVAAVVAAGGGAALVRQTPDGRGGDVGARPLLAVHGAVVAHQRFLRLHRVAPREAAAD